MAMNLESKTVFITGAAGFIGFNLAMQLLKTTESIHIVGIDTMNDYYDVNIKEWRLSQIEECVREHEKSSWIFIHGSIAVSYTHLTLPTT